MARDKSNVLSFERELVLTEEDFENGQILYQQQLVSPLNDEKMFRAGLYCILSAAQNYDTQIKVYNTFLKEKLDTPEGILGNMPKVRKITKPTRFYNRKYKFICCFSSLWRESDISNAVIKDATNGKKGEYNLRYHIADTFPGLSYKCASLFMTMCGYANVVPVDIWIMRYLKSRGHDVRVTDYKKESGLTDDEYFFYEGIFSEIARKEYKVSPAMLQAAIWAKQSRWNNNTRNATLETYGIL